MEAKEDEEELGSNCCVGFGGKARQYWNQKSKKQNKKYHISDVCYCNSVSFIMIVDIIICTYTYIQINRQTNS